MLENHVKYRVGSLAKPLNKMSDLELAEWQEQGKKEIREYLFSINQPLVYYCDGILVAEYKNGRIEKFG